MTQILRKAFWPSAIAVAFLVFLGAIGGARPAYAEVDSVIVVDPEVIADEGACDDGDGGLFSLSDDDAAADFGIYYAGTTSSSGVLSDEDDDEFIDSDDDDEKVVDREETDSGEDTALITTSAIEPEKATETVEAAESGGTAQKPQRITYRELRSELLSRFVTEASAILAKSEMKEVAQAEK